MTQNNGNGQQGFFNFDGREFTIVEKLSTVQGCIFLGLITLKNIKPHWLRKQARNGKVEIPYVQGMLIAEIMDTSLPNSWMWRIKLRPNAI